MPCSLIPTLLGKYLGGAYGGAILLTQDGGETWLRLDTAGWNADGVLYPMGLVRKLSLVDSDQLTVLPLVHWPPELQGLWMLHLRSPHPRPLAPFGITGQQADVGLPV